MADDKTKLPKERNILATSALNGKSITGVEAYQHGITTVFEISFSGGSQFLKVQQLKAEVGGTADWGTGTQVL